MVLAPSCLLIFQTTKPAWKWKREELGNGGVGKVLKRSEKEVQEQKDRRRRERESETETV